MQFDEKLKIWLKENLVTDIPEEVKAFSFNLSEISTNQYSIELVGAETFDTEDPDWACDEIWEATPRNIEIPESFASGHWEECLNKIRVTLSEIIQTEELVKLELSKKEGIGLGFVDGELELINLK